MNILKIIIVIVIVAIVLWSFFKPSKNMNIKTVDNEEFESIIADTAHVTLVDVRTADEFGEGHIAGAMNIDVLEKDFKDIATKTLDKDKTIAVYCRSGRRSLNAADILQKEGYSVVNLKGGYMAWKAYKKK